MKAAAQDGDEWSVAYNRVGVTRVGIGCISEHT